MDRQSHWNKIWIKYRETEVSWFQESPKLSFEYIERYAIDNDARILDVGGGSSRLVDSLLTNGYENLGVLDVAEPALERARVRLGSRSSSVEWIVADVTAYETSSKWDVWHDRAVFHFLIDDEERRAYVRSVRIALTSDGIVVIATFGPDGPEKCSGLDVKRHSPETLCQSFGPEFVLLESDVEIHHTPDGTKQQFVYCVFRRCMIRE